jgi:hypothetical protein
MASKVFNIPEINFMIFKNSLDYGFDIIAYSRINKCSYFNVQRIIQNAKKYFQSIQDIYTLRELNEKLFETQLEQLRSRPFCKCGEPTILRENTTKRYFTCQLLRCKYFLFENRYFPEFEIEFARHGLNMDLFKNQRYILMKRYFEKEKEKKYIKLKKYDKYLKKFHIRGKFGQYYYKYDTKNFYVVSNTLGL